MKITSLQFWREFQKLAQRLKSDPALLEAFRNDPLGVLKDAGLDLVIESGTDGRAEKTLSDAINEMDEPQRLATLQSIGQVSMVDVDHEMVITPIANANVFANVNLFINANVGANANIYVNANANANANANVNGFAGAMVRDDYTSTVYLSSSYRDSLFAQVMASMHLSESRQKALLKRALVDSVAIRRTQEALGAERRVVHYEYKGMEFEVEGLLTKRTIKDVQARFLD